jgi:cytochrome b561
VTALTGAAWFATQGSSAALDWREAHSVAARVMAGLVVAHVVSVSLHLVELVRS